VKHRGILQAICVGVVGVALALAPMSVASAKSKGKHPTKGSNPGAAMCQDVKNEQAGQSSVGTAIEKAVASGNFAAAKQAMLNAYDADAGDVAKALAVIKSAPANVQAAFKNLLTYVQQIKNDIASAQSEQQLLADFETLGKNTQLQQDGTTISAWYTSVCGSSVPATSGSSTT